MSDVYFVSYLSNQSSHYFTDNKSCKFNVFLPDDSFFPRELTQKKVIVGLKSLSFQFTESARTNPSNIIGLKSSLIDHQANRSDDQIFFMTQVSPSETVQHFSVSRPLYFVSSRRRLASPSFEFTIFNPESGKFEPVASDLLREDTVVHVEVVIRAIDTSMKLDHFNLLVTSADKESRKMFPSNKPYDFTIVKRLEFPENEKWVMGLKSLIMPSLLQNAELPDFGIKYWMEMRPKDRDKHLPYVESFSGELQTKHFDNAEAFFTSLAELLRRISTIKNAFTVEEDTNTVKISDPAYLVYKASLLERPQPPPPEEFLEDRYPDAEKEKEGPLEDKQQQPDVAPAPIVEDAEMKEEIPLPELPPNISMESFDDDDDEDNIPMHQDEYSTPKKRKKGDDDDDDDDDELEEDAKVAKKIEFEKEEDETDGKIRKDPCTPRKNKKDPTDPLYNPQREERRKKRREKACAEQLAAAAAAAAGGEGAIGGEALYDSDEDLEEDSEIKVEKMGWGEDYDLSRKILLQDGFHQSTFPVTLFPQTEEEEGLERSVWLARRVELAREKATHTFHLYLELSSMLAKMFGISEADRIIKLENDEIWSSYNVPFFNATLPPNLTLAVPQTILLQCDLVEDSLVGNQKLPMLKPIFLGKKVFERDTQHQFHFTIDQWHEIKMKNVSRFNLSVSDLLGNHLSVQESQRELTTIVELIFKRVDHDHHY